MQFFTKEGTAIDVPDEHAAEAYATGDFGLPAGAAVPVRLQNGKVGTVPSEELHAAITKHGAQIVSPGVLQDARDEAQYGGFAGGLEASAVGAARGLTVGAFDPLAIGATRLLSGDEEAEAYRKKLAALEKVHPFVSGASELAGSLAPLLASGGTSAALEGAEAASALSRAAEAGGSFLRGAGTLSRGVEGAGQLAERGVARLVGGGAEGLAGRVAQKALPEAANAATQGMLYSAGDQLSENALSGEPDANGEKMLAALGHGALLGGVLGGALGSAGVVGREVLGRAAPKIAAAAEDQAWRAVSGRVAFQKEAERIPGGGRAIGRVLLDDKLVDVGDKVEDAAEKIAAARSAQGQKIGALLDSMDAHGVEGPRVSDIWASVKRDVMPELEKMGETNAAAIEKVRATMRDLVNFAGGEEAALEGRLTFKQAQEFRSTLDSHIRFQTNPMAPINETTNALKGVRNVIEDALIEAGEKGEKIVGGAWSKEYQAAKLRYRQLKVADMAAEDTVKRFGANAQHSLTDKLMASSLMNAGFLHGATSGATHALAAGGLHGAALGIIGGAISKQVRTRGNSTAAVILDKLAALGAVQRAQRAIERQMDRGIAVALRGDERAIVLRDMSHEGYDEKVANVTRAIGSADAHADQVAQAISPIAQHAPETSNAFERAALRITAFLASKIPAGHRESDSLTPQLDHPRVSSMEKAQFERVYAVAHDPVGHTMTQLARGTLTQAEVEALRAMYPKLYQEIGARVHHELSTRRTPLPRAKAQPIRTLLGMPLANPAYVNALQANFGPPATAMGPAPGQSGAPKRQIKGIAQANALTGSGLSRVH